MARGAGCETADIPRRLWFPLNETSRSAAAALLVEEGAGRFPMLAAFAPGASKGPRAWHIDRFAQVARVLAHQHGAGIVVLGGRGDREAADTILEAVGGSGIDACGRTNLWQMGALIERCRVFVGNDEIRLTRTEYNLLATLVKHAGKVVTHRQLLKEVWGPGSVDQSHYVRVYMGQLRHKLEKEPARPRYLVTETGVGYRLKTD